MNPSPTCVVLGGGHARTVIDRFRTSVAARLARLLTTAASRDEIDGVPAVTAARTACSERERPRLGSRVPNVVTRIGREHLRVLGDPTSSTRSTTPQPPGGGRRAQSRVIAVLDEMGTRTIIHV